MSDEHYREDIVFLSRLIEYADAVVVGAGSGLSTAGGLDFGGQLFKEHFASYQEKYGFTDGLSGSTYPFKTEEAYWAYWAKLAKVFDFDQNTLPIYQNLREILQGVNYYVITTNVDDQFLHNGFDPNRLFCHQGSFQYVQCAVPCQELTYDFKSQYLEMAAQTDGDLQIPSHLVPHCPHCGEPMAPHIREDDTFVEDEHWQKSKKGYDDFIEAHEGQLVLYLELGVGFMTPSIIKFPFYRFTRQNPNAYYVTVSLNGKPLPQSLRQRSLVIQEDLDKVIKDLLTLKSGRS